MERAPVFVKVEEFDDIQDIFETINKRLEKAHSLLDHLNEIKNRESEFVTAWKRDLEDIEERFSNITKALAEPES